MKRMPLVSSALLLAVSLSAGCSSSRSPDTAQGQMSFGVKAARLNLWREARFRFERATQNNPNDAMAHNNLAVALEGAGEFDHARLEYLRALELDQSNQYIQKNYSRFMEFYGKKKKETPKAAAGDAKQSATPANPAGPALPPVDVAPAPPGTQEPPSAAPGPGSAGPPSTSPPIPVTPNPAPPAPNPEPTPPPNGGTTGGQR